MLIFKKEKKVVQLATQHAEKTGECLAITIQAIRAFTANDLGELDAQSRQVDALETEADTLLRGVRELLYSGAYLPTIRGDLYRLLSAVDRVTNRIESCLEFVNLQRPVAIQHYHAEIDEILDLTEQCFGELRKALKSYFDPKAEVEELRAHSRRVGQIESQVDASERRLTRSIFESEISLSEKMHLKQLLSRITRISDQVENAADELELLSLKSII